MLALSIATPSVRAQAVYGSIAGNVVDSTGAAVPGATVTITSVERKTADTVVTNATGFYEKGRLLPGTYDVRVELAGFKAKVVSAVTVNVDSQTKVDLALELGEMTETVDGRRPSRASSSRPTGPTSPRPSRPSCSRSCRSSTGTSPSSSC